MKVQTLFIVASAICGALAAPIEKRDPKTVTVYEKVVHVVTATSTVWVKPSKQTSIADEENANHDVPTTYSPQHTTTSSRSTTTSTTSTTSTSTSTTSTSSTSTTSTTPTPTPTPTPTTTSTSTSIEEPTTTYVPPTTTTEAPTTTESPEPETTSSYVPPTTSSTTSSTSTPSPEPSPEPSQEPETTLVPETTFSATVVPTSTTVPVPSASPEANGGSTGGTEGQATFYTPGVGSCGDSNNEGDFVAALSHVLMAAQGVANPNLNPLCGKKIRCTRGSKSVDVTIVDTCPGCAADHVDMSPAAFNELGTPEEGVIPIYWYFVD